MCGCIGVRLWSVWGCGDVGCGDVGCGGVECGVWGVRG